jgi:ParB family chromosome partitioning protein
VATEPRRRLGRGLDALLGAFPPDSEERAAGIQVTAQRGIPIALIDRNPRNPRRDFRAAELEELANSLRQHGMVQPIVVRAAGGRNERYEIIAGERRWRAAQIAGLHEIPATVLDVSDRQALELAIVENVQRADLNPIEEARGYQALIEEFGYTQADLGATIGKSRVHVTNALRLLRLPESVLRLLESGQLSAGHGRALLSARFPERLAQTIIEGNVSVREAERLAGSPEDQPRSRPRRKPAKSTDTVALERELAALLGVHVEVRDEGEGRGELRLSYRSLEQLDYICRRLRAG